MSMREINAVRPNCARIDKQIATFEKEKAENDQRLLAGIQSVAPALAALNLVAGTYGRNVAIATGEWAARSTASLPSSGAPRRNAELMRVLVLTVLCWVCALLAAAPAKATEAGVKAQGEGLSAYVSVAGAPGDGEQALAAALARRLSAMGVKQASAFEANTYDIQGTVRVSPAHAGKETVTIIWVVLGPDDNQFGVTRQTKDVKKGSLDKKWGRAADAAAAAAAADIVKLLPQSGQ
jgi:hypothetical protein